MRLRILIILLTIIALPFILIWAIDWLNYKINPPERAEYGVSFSLHYTKELGLQPVEVYQNIVDNLGVKKLRIPVYWNQVEINPNEFDFTAYDQLLDLASTQNAKVILAIGYKVPRWPECFPPSWVKDNDNQQYQKQILNLLRATVDHFKNRPEISSWQIENEPLLPFGVCRMFDEQFLKQEVDLVRSKDSRPIVLTDAGELGSWVTAMKYSDLMGTSLYRIVWNPIFGFFRYPFPPLYYQLKANITKAIFAPNSQGVFVSELQAEPWAPGKSLNQMSPEEQVKIFSLKDLQDVVKFTSRTHIREQYFWGVEWWYWMKLHGHPEYWNYAKTLFK
jgi:hypothetical protein